MLQRLATLLALTMAVPTFVGAQAPPVRGFAIIADDAENQPVEVRLYRKMTVVVIGIDEYADPLVNDLSYAVRDAEGMEQVLREQYVFDPVYKLLNEEATRDNILEMLQTRLPKETTADDAVLVFFSGHGETVATNAGPIGYLIPHDGARGRLQRNISMSVLRDDVSRLIPARHVFFIVDACYGGLLTTKAALPETSRSIEYLQSIAERPARQVLAAGMADQEVLDGGPLGYGVFTGRVVQALQDAADYLTANELAVTVRERVYRDAEARRHEQTPTHGYLSGDGDFVFVPKRQSLAQLEADTARLEAELAVIRREREGASLRNDGLREAEEASRQAETEEKLRQARQQERLEAQRQARAAEAEVAARQAEEQRREEERKRHEEAARAEELRRKLEQEQAQQDSARADMTLGEAIVRLSELRQRITDVEAQVRAEVAQEKELVRPAFIQAVAPKDQFETTAEFTGRRRRIEEGNASERARYQREIAAADASLPERLGKATSGFHSAITALTTRDRPVASGQVTAKLGPYDADIEEFSYEVSVEGIRSSLTGTLPIPRDAARSLYEAAQAGAMIVTLSGSLSEDGSVRLGEPSFGAPNLPKTYPGRPFDPTALPGSPDRPTGTPEADRLLQELRREDVTDVRRRDIGKRLAAVGDPRPGVGVRSGVPDVEWVFVSPGGSVDIDGTRKSVSPFYIARYPVTYAQYEAFVEASDGFDNPQWWQGMPSKYRPPNRKLAAQRNSLLNAPRENVSWYQAVAFTRWLSARLQAKNASVSVGGVRASGVDW